MLQSLHKSSIGRAAGFTVLRGVLSRTVLGIALVVGSNVAISPVLAAATHASFSVSTVVMPRTAILAASMPEALEISSSDVERGFVDVTTQSTLVVTNNSPGGFELDVWPVGSVFSSVAVYGVGADAQLDADGGSICLRGRTGPSMPMRLAFRFKLAAGTVPGRYRWPLQFAIQPVK